LILPDKSSVYFQKPPNLADFTFVLDEHGNPVEMICPNEKTGVVETGRTVENLMATFSRSDCVDCPLLARCAMRVLKKTDGRRLYFSVAAVHLARRRQRMKLERKSGRNLRSAVEATMHEISCRLEHGRLRVRGKFRVGMTMTASAAMANARRIWRYQAAEKTAEQRRLETLNGQVMWLFRKIGTLFHLNGRISVRASRFSVLVESVIFFTCSRRLVVIF